MSVRMSVPFFSSNGTTSHIVGTHFCSTLGPYVLIVGSNCCAAMGSKDFHCRKILLLNHDLGSHEDKNGLRRNNEMESH
jgi:hypothetical protein